MPSPSRTSGSSRHRTQAAAFRNPGQVISINGSRDASSTFAKIMTQLDARTPMRSPRRSRGLRKKSASEFRELREHGDVSEWIEQGGTAAQLLARAKAGRLPNKGYELIRASDVQPKNIVWLWRGHLPGDELEVLAGLPGAGKSQIQCSYVACVTTWVTWPDGANGQGRRNVIMLTAEDTIQNVLVPRLIAAGADRDRVWIIGWVRQDDKKRMFLLGEDLAKLEDAVEKIGDVGLICIDPITAYMGGKLDSHRATDVRNQLGPLKDFAERLHIGLSAVTHPAKNAGARALDHYLGSQA